MINDMRKMAEALLALPRPNDSGDDLTPDQRRLGVLCESHEVGTPVYVLHSAEKGIARLRRQEMQSSQSWRAPWIKPGGPNSAYLIPVFKVDRQKGGAKSKRIRTMGHFEQVADSDDHAASYFGIALEILRSSRFIRPGHDQVARNISDAYGTAIDEIVSRDAMLNKATPLLVVAIDPEGDIWPGDDPRLVRWLLNTEHRLTIYGKPESPSRPAASCALCTSSGPLYPNALPGAGLNFVNGAFRGSFPEMRDANAWQRFAICSGCADLLFVYKNHVAPGFVEPVVGSNALIIPSADVGSNTEGFGGFLKDIRRMMDQADRVEGERTVLRRLSGEATVATLSLLWAENFGQKIDGIRGFVTHVLPTRLAELGDVNKSFNHPPADQPRNPFYPIDPRDGVRRRIDLNLKIADEILRRTGGQKVKSENQSPRRRALLYEIAECVFHKELRMDPEPLWQEIDQTAQSYWRMLLDQTNAGILYQCHQEAPKQHQAGKWLPLTLNGWVRHLYLFLDYLSDERVNVWPEETAVYEASQASLKPFLSEAKGLDTDAKVFTFLVGILYGHLTYVQAKKAEVNVAANALSWMRGGRLRAADLHALYGKIAAKLFEYDALDGVKYHKSKEIHELEAEIGHVGKRVRVPIRPEELPDEQVLYFLMLGIALSYTFSTSGMTRPKGDDQ